MAVFEFKSSDLAPGEAVDFDLLNGAQAADKTEGQQLLELAENLELRLAQGIEQGKISPDELKATDLEIQKIRRMIGLTLHPDQIAVSGAADMLRHGVRYYSDLLGRVKQGISPELRARIVDLTAGNPPTHGWGPPDYWIQQLIATLQDERSCRKMMAYPYSLGEPAARKAVLDSAREEFSDTTLDIDHIVCTDGVAHGIEIILALLRKDIGLRIINPAPSYPSFTALDYWHAEKPPIFYPLNPDQNWEPDMNALESQLQEHPEAIGILIINPNNPTGRIYTPETLDKFVGLAQKYNRILICDQIYYRLILEGEYAPLTQVAQNRVPILVLKGASKDVPVPGFKSGSIEGHNMHLHPGGEDYWKAIQALVQAMVGATAMLQNVNPYKHQEFPQHLEGYRTELGANIREMCTILQKAQGLKVTRPEGGMYIWTTFENGALKSSGQSLKWDGEFMRSENSAGRRVIEEELANPNLEPDAKFCLHLFASKLVQAIPATAFWSPVPGFRIVGLPRDPEVRRRACEAIREGAEEYLRC